MGRLTAQILTARPLIFAAIVALGAGVGCTTTERLGWVFGFNDLEPDASEAEHGSASTESAAASNEDDSATRIAERHRQAMPDDPFSAPDRGTRGFERSQTRPASFEPGSPVSSASVLGDLPSAGGQMLGRSARGRSGANNLAQVSFSMQGGDFDPDLADDGSFLAFASTQHSETADIYKKSVEGRTVTQLTSSAANDVMPAVSPDGSRIAFASDRNGSWDIYMMGAGGGQPVQITDDPAQELHPSWSPDGSMLVYCRLGEVSGRWELWVTEVNNSGVRHYIADGLLPEWSPVDDRIVFQRARQRGDRLFSVWTIEHQDGEGANPTQIVSSPAAAIVTPSWSSDGRRLAFSVIPDPTHEFGEKPAYADLWISNLDGTDRANLTDSAFVNLMPTWGANGRIYFISDRGGTDNVWSLTPERAIITATGGENSDDDLATAPTGEDEP